MVNAKLRILPIKGDYRRGGKEGKLRK
jgi:hypothetical protein